MINHPDLPKPENHVLYNEDKDAHLDEHLMTNSEEWQHLEEALQEVDQLMIDGAARKKPCLDVTDDLTDLCLATTTRSATKRQRAGGYNPQAPSIGLDGLRAFRLTFPHLEFRIKCRKLRRPPRRPKDEGQRPLRRPRKCAPKDGGLWGTACSASRRG